MNFRAGVFCIRNYAYAACLTLLTGASCTFSAGEYIHPIGKPFDSIPARVDILSYAVDIDTLTDPYQLVFTTFFSFNIDSYSKDIRSIQLFIDDSLRQTYASTNPTLFRFALDPALYDDGAHNVLVRVLLATGSGSMADILGLEHYVIEKNFAFVVDTTPPGPVAPMTAIFENGRLELSWSASDRENFVYFLHWDIPELSLPVGDTTLSPQTTSFHDEGYVGGKIRYSLSMIGSGFYIPAASLNFEFDPLDANVTVDENHVAQIAWSKPVGVNDDALIEVSGRNWEKTFPLSARAITGDSLKLGDNIMQSISVLRGDYPSRRYEEVFPVQYFGRRIEKFECMAVLPTLNKFFIAQKRRDDVTLFRYDLTTFNIEDSVSLIRYHDPQDMRFFISQDEANLYFGYSRYSTGYAFVKLDPLDFSALTEIPLDEILTLNYDMLSGERPQPSAVSDNNLLSLQYQATDYRTRACLFNLNTNTIVWSMSNVGLPKLSADGRFLIFSQFNEVRAESEGIIYEWNQSDWNFLGKIPHSPMVFLDAAAHEVISADGSNVRVYDPTGQAGEDGYFPPVRSTALPNVVGFEPVSQYIITQTIDAGYSRFRVYDSEMFSYQGKAEAYVSEQPLKYLHYYFNGYNFIGSGGVEKLK